MQVHCRSTTSSQTEAPKQANYSKPPRQQPKQASPPAGSEQWSCDANGPAWKDPALQPSGTVAGTKTQIGWPNRGPAKGYGGHHCTNKMVTIRFILLIPALFSTSEHQVWYIFWVWSHTYSVPNPPRMHAMPRSKPWETYMRFTLRIPVVYMSTCWRVVGNSLVPSLSLCYHATWSAIDLIT